MRYVLNIKKTLERIKYKITKMQRFKEELIKQIQHMYPVCGDRTGGRIVEYADR